MIIKISRSDCEATYVDILDYDPDISINLLTKYLF